MIKSWCNWKWSDYCDEIFGGNPQWEQYGEAECAAHTFEYMGLITDNAGTSADNRSVVYFDDPDDDLGATINGVTYPRTNSTVIKEQDGKTYYELYDSDIIFNDTRTWGMDYDIKQSCSGDVYSIQSTATHEVGHGLGMGHSCDDGESCRDTSLANATMYWSGGPCDTSRASINEDDIAGMTALYGPFATFSTDSALFGGVPLTVDFHVESDDVITSTTWRFGDGESSDEFEPSHTYNTEGQFTVTVEFEGTSDTCGIWDSQYRQLAYTLVCEPPKPEFSYEAVSDLEYQLVNVTPVTTYGCIDDLHWTIYKGDTEVETFSAWSPKVDFPETGSYRVVLEIGGPGGSSAAELEFEVDGKGPKGCSSTPGGAPLGLAGLALALGAVLRRRD